MKAFQLLGHSVSSNRRKIAGNVIKGTKTMPWTPGRAGTFLLAKEIETVEIYPSIVLVCIGLKATATT